MSVIVRPKRRPTNRFFLAGAFAGAIAWSLWPAPDTYWQADACFWMFSAATVGGLWSGAQELILDHRLRGAYAASERVTDDHGSAREATWAEVKAAGMADPNSGNFLGLYQGRAPVLAPPKTPFALIEMPPGAGKTVNCVIGSILHRARIGASVVVADPKLELGVMLGPQLRAQGYEVWFANPTQGFADLCGDIELNPYQALLDAVHATDAKRRAPNSG